MKLYSGASPRNLDGSPARLPLKYGGLSHNFDFEQKPHKEETPQREGTLLDNSQKGLSEPLGELPLSSHGSPPSLLDNFPTKLHANQHPTNGDKKEWTPQQKRAYHRILSGLKYHRGELLRFLTLTTAEGMIRPLNESFRCLKERIKRMTPRRLIKLGYIDRKELRKYYPNKPLDEPLKFDYCKVETSEGVKGVYHILYFGDYIPQKWVSDVWREITGVAYIVDIRACKEPVKSPKKLARYCVAQYVSGQTAFVRYSWSWGWVGKGFVGVWKKLIDAVNGDVKLAIKKWDELLSGKEFVIAGWVFKPPPDIRVVDLLQGEIDAW